MATTAKRTTVLVDPSGGHLTEDLFRLASGVLVQLLHTPEGADACAGHLRSQGWRCEPPAAASAPKKRRTRKEG